MAMVHNSIIRGYNSIYNQAPHISDADKSHFVGYCLTWHKFLKSHADNEDVSLFPYTEKLLKDTGIWEESHKEHGKITSQICRVRTTRYRSSDLITCVLDAFEPGLAKFREYLVSLKSPVEFSGARLLDIMGSFQEPLGIHLQSEINTIASFASHPNRPKVGSPEEQTQKDAFDTREGKKLAMSGMTDVFPFFLFNFDGDYEDGLWMNWPPIPGLIRWTVMRVSSGLHPGWWKFASCDVTRKRKELYAIGNTEVAP
jgi:hypothetical protein